MRIFVIGSVVVGVSMGTAANQGSKLNHPTHAMNTIVVTASAQQENIHEALASIDVVDGQSLKQRYVADLSDALSD